MTSEEPVDGLVALNRDIAEWEQRRDDASTAELERILSPALVFRRADGKVVGKDTFMDALRNKGPFARRESRDISVTVLGDRALVTLIVFATRVDGSVGRYRNIRVFFRREGNWQLEVWFNDDVSCLPGLLGIS